MIQPELKFIDITTAPVSIANTGTAYNCVELIQQGAGANNCIGTKYTVKWIEVYMNFYLLQDQAVATIALCKDVNWLHIALVLDTQCNGVQAPITDIWTGNSPTTPRKVDNEQRFKILKEEFIVQSCNSYVYSTAFNSGREASKMIKWKVPCSTRIDITPNGGTIANLRSNSLSVYIRSENNAYSAINNGHIRTRFIDV